MNCIDLQNCMDIVDGQTGNCSGTGVTYDDDGTEEVSITVEDTIDIKEEFSIQVDDTIDIKDEIPEAIIFTPVKNEQEVSIRGVCVCLWWFQLMHSGHLWPESTSCRLQ
jgi:hypothetical protein